MNEQVDSGDVEGNLSSLDRWVEAVKDASLVSVGIIASYMSLAYGGEVAIGLAFVILAVSMLSSIFLPYKVAVTRSSVPGVFSRYRALELILVIVISWIIPSSLILSDLGLSSQLPPHSESRFVEGVLTLILPTLIVVFVILLGGFGLSRKVFGRVGFADRFFEKYEKYPWGLGYTALFFVSLFVIRAQLLLLEAVQTYAESPNLAVSIYARAFGPMIVLVLLCCALAYFEPERVLVYRGELISRGEVIFGLIGGGVLVALASPVIGFLLSLVGVLVLIRYSSSLPPLDTEEVLLRTEETRKREAETARLFKAAYPRGYYMLSYARTVLFVIIAGSLYFLLLFDPAQFELILSVMAFSMFGWFVLAAIELVLKMRLIRGSAGSEHAPTS